MKKLALGSKSISGAIFCNSVGKDLPAMMTSILNSKLLGKENLLLVDGLESISLNGLEDENAL